MRYAYLLLFFVPSFVFAQQRAQIGTYFAADMPVKSFMPKMSTNLGMGLQFAYKPIQRVPVFLELKGSLGSYCSRTMQQTYNFGNGSSTTTDVTYTSALNRVTFGTKIHIGHEFRAVRGYITPQVGSLVMRSKIVIADPQDEDDCKPLERRTMQRDGGFFYGGEAGVEISMNKLFRGIQSENQHRLYTSVNFMSGFNQFEYINIKHMKDHDHSAMEGGHTEEPATAEGRDVNTTFINVSTNSLHEHKIAELYRTDLRMWGFTIGYVFSF